MVPELNVDWVRYIFTNMDDAVCVTQMNGELLYANPSAEKLFGFTLRGPVRIWEAIPYVDGNDELIQLFIDSVMEKQKSIRSIVDYVNNEGRVFHLHVSLTCETEQEGRILIVISDLTNLQKVSSAFARYTSPEIANYVLSTPEGEKQGGQTRDVSILMSDLRGFTAMSTRMSSGELITMLNHYFEWMTAVIERYRGTVIEFLGDGIFVVFGAPGNLPDHVTAAVSCAVEMQNAMASVNQWNQENGYPALEMGIGIHSGAAVVGNIGSDRKMKYGCMGETVNLAGRIESVSIGGQILISGATRNRVREKLTIADQKGLMAKGAAGEIQVFSITGIGEQTVQTRADKAVDWIRLVVERDVLVYSLREKTVEQEARKAHLTRVSRDGKYGMLTTETELTPLQNLLLKTDGQDVYAKVLDRTKDGYRLYFSQTMQVQARDTSDT